MDFYPELLSCHIAISIIIAIGCADLEEIPDADVRRTDSTAVVKCKTTQETMHLICRGNKWIGDLKNCTVEITDGDSLIYPSIGTNYF